MFEITLKDIDVLATLSNLKNVIAVEVGKFLGNAGEYTEQQIKLRMSQGISPEGGAYPPNYEIEAGKGYKTWKEEHYPGKPPLILTGALKESIEATIAQDEAIVTPIGGTHPSVGWRFEQEGTMLEVAERQELGLPYAMYPRPFMAINEDEVNMIFHMFCRILEPDFV